MKLIIDIPDEIYKDIKDWKIRNFDFRIPLSCILEGKVLPKRHGDLIDRDELSPKIHGVKSIVAVLEAPTIIEADKENDNETDN